MSLIFLPHSERSRPLVDRLRAVETQRPCGRTIEVLVLAMGKGFDVSVSNPQDEKQEPSTSFSPFNSTRWRLPMSEDDAVAAFADWAAKGYPVEEEPMAWPEDDEPLPASLRS